MNDIEDIPAGSGKSGEQDWDQGQTGQRDSTGQSQDPYSDQLGQPGANEDLDNDDLDDEMLEEDDLDIEEVAVDSTGGSDYGSGQTSRRHEGLIDDQGEDALAREAEIWTDESASTDTDRSRSSIDDPTSSRDRDRDQF